MLEISESSRMEQDKDNHYFRIIHTVRFVLMRMSRIFEHIFSLLQCKFLAEIIRHTINLCTFSLCEHSGNRLNVIIEHYKFNTFIAMFLIISEIYLFLFRTHVILQILLKT